MDSDSLAKGSAVVAAVLMILRLIMLSGRLTNLARRLRRRR